MKGESSYIDGQYSKVNSEKLNVINKYTGEEICSISMADESEIKLAIESSKKSFLEYSKLSAEKRYDLLSNFLKEFLSCKDELIELLVIEAGKPISYANSEYERCVETIRFGIEEVRRIGGEVVPMDFGLSENRKAFTQKFPIGPVLAISPFNFPLNLSLHKIVPALASGCSIILKPSPYTPSSCLLLAEIAMRAGFPKGLLNVVVCDNEKSELLVRDDSMKLLSFTGSPKIGWFLKSIAGKKKVVLELGGNASVIVDSSEDLAKIAKEVAKGAFLYSGQICISTQKVFVRKSLFEEFKKLLIKEVSLLETGDPKDKETIVGPLIDKVHVSRVLSWVEESKNAGANILCGGSLCPNNSNIILPTVIENYKDEDLVNREEIFGPVVLLKEFENDSEVIELVNDSRFGLQVGVYTNRIDFMKACFCSIEVGAVIMNSVPGFRVDHMPYGGIKDSGLGREGIRYAIDDMCEEKLLVI